MLVRLSWCGQKWWLIDTAHARPVHCDDMPRSSSVTLFPQTPPIITRRTQHFSAAASNFAERADAHTAESGQPPAKRRPPTFALYTLGCKVNQYDSHQIARALLQRGFRRVEFREAADLYVIDTCTVTAEADRKSRKAAGRARRNNADAVVAITGCAAAYAADQFRRVVPDALVLDNTRKFELPELAFAALRSRPDWAENYARYRAQTASEPVPAATRERAVLKIQDGCDHRCSYCIIPMVRGASATQSREAVLQEARTLVREGAREITITGVSLSDWGRARTGAETPNADSEKQRGRNAELCSLLRAVASVEGLERVRVSSLDPADVDEEFLRTVAHTPRLCPHIHLALQAGAASTLRRMRRRYTPDMFLRAARHWRAVQPDGGLTTDIIVGFPGETDADFEESLRVARAAKFSAIHVFPYSPRGGTFAATLPDHVAAAEQKRRVDALLALALQLSAEYAVQFVGQDLPLLVENIDTVSGVVEGMTPHYVKARVRLNASLLTSSTPATATSVAVGDIVWFRVENWREGSLEGTQQPRPTSERNQRMYARS
jgi:threonylcarbamoyladenosine tRNA methylthiotransferase MtaB